MIASIQWILEKKTMMMMMNALYLSHIITSLSFIIVHIITTIFRLQPKQVLTYHHYHSSMKWNVENASIILLFTVTIAFDTFAELTRQLSWLPWLKSVINIISDDDNDNSIDDETKEIECRVKRKEVVLVGMRKGPILNDHLLYKGKMRKDY